MIRFRSNGPDVARGIRKAIGDTGQVANSDRTFRQIMRDGTDRHFRLGRMGASMTALSGSGGGRPSFSVVSWDMSRHPITEQRSGSSPILRGSKGILESAFVRSAFYRQISTPGGSGASYGPRDAKARALGIVHQFGGKPLPDAWGHNSGYPQGFTIPTRPFVFWDRTMVNESIKRIRLEFNRSVKSSGGRA